MLENFFTENECDQLRQAGVDFTKNLPNTQERSVFYTNEPNKQVCININVPNYLLSIYPTENYLHCFKSLIFKSKRVYYIICDNIFIYMFFYILCYFSK